MPVSKRASVLSTIGKRTTTTSAASCTTGASGNFATAAFAIFAFFGMVCRTDHQCRLRNCALGNFHDRKQIGAHHPASRRAFWCLRYVLHTAFP